MLTSLTVENWKSFEKATLYIDALTVLIGMNASGKSNLLDALVFLNRVACGAMLTAALQGDGAMLAMRGGAEWAVRKTLEKFSLGVTIRISETLDIEYRIECAVNRNRCSLLAEHLGRIQFGTDQEGKRLIGTASRRPVFRANKVLEGVRGVTATLAVRRSNPQIQLNGSASALYQLAGMHHDAETSGDINAIIESLRNIFILDPVPSHMRDFSQLADRFEPDARNIAGVIAALPEASRLALESTPPCA